MRSPRLSCPPRRRTAARLLLSAAAVAAGLISTVGAASATVAADTVNVGNGGNVACPAGLTQLAKFEYGSTYRLVEGTAGVVTITDGTAQGGSFTSSQPVGAVIVKGASGDAVVHTYVPSVTSGTFDNTGLVNGGDNVPAVSNVKFCLGAPIAPPPAPVDVCSNIEGAQAVIPTGMVAGPNGSCVAPPVDVCSNIAGDQAVVPSGMTAVGGVCTTPAVTVVVPVDVCSNIAGDQAVVPSGMTAVGGVCTAPAVAGVVISQPVVAAQPTVTRPAVLEPVLPQGAPIAAAPVVGPTTEVLGVTVSRPAAAATQLPRTGGDSTTVAALGTGLLLAGAAMVATSRRRSAGALAS